MSERRDRSAERRADRARPSRDTGARARSRSPSRVDSGVDSSATNPYSTRDRDGRSTDWFVFLSILFYAVFSLPLILLDMARYFLHQDPHISGLLIVLKCPLS